MSGFRCGKTTLARLVANRTNAVFKELSATVVGINEVRTVVEEARSILNLTGRYVKGLLGLPIIAVTGLIAKPSCSLMKCIASIKHSRQVAGFFDRCNTLLNQRRIFSYPFWSTVMFKSVS